jgi:CheY-like chemotaxis protein
MMDAGERGAALVGQLLAFSRKQLLNLKVVDPNRLVEDMSKMLFRIIRENVKIQLRTKGSVRNIIADKGQFEQVLLNLVVNARDAMPDGGDLTIETSDRVVTEDRSASLQELAPGDYVVLSVSDTGSGIDRDVLERMFEPFYTTKETGKGTGLGLATVFGIMKQHNGHIEVETEKGRGTVFHAYFPAGGEDESDQMVKEQMRSSRGDESILLVEDDSTVREMLVDALRPLGYKVTAFPSGNEALEHFRENGDFDLLLTDLVLPGMNGRELVDKVRELRPGMKTVIMSGYVPSQDEKERIMVTDIPFISKPIIPSALLKVLREIFDRT